LVQLPVIGVFERRKKVSPKVAKVDERLKPSP